MALSDRIDAAVDAILGRTQLSSSNAAILTESARDFNPAQPSGLYDDNFNVNDHRVHLLRERIAELQLELEDRGWARIGDPNDTTFEFDRQAIRSICRLARLNFLKNPIINRGVNIQAIYVWGQGVKISARDPIIAKVIKRFWEDKGNRAEFTSHRARTLKECDLQVDGNIFFALFTNTENGAVSIRTLPVNQVERIIHNPNDRKDPWFYQRLAPKATVQTQFGLAQLQSETIYYRDWQLDDEQHFPQGLPETQGKGRFAENVSIFHQKVGGLSEMQFGVSETYQAIDWARAYKEFLEDWATIVKSLSRFAWKATGPANIDGLAMAQAAMGTTVTVENDEDNPAPAAGSLVYESGDFSITPMPKTGATIQADDGRRLLLMACAALGLPETFMSDVSIGTLATAESLDRPTELKFRDRQQLWKDSIEEILEYVIIEAAKAGYLGLEYREVDVDTDDNIQERESRVFKDGKELDVHVECSFPPVLERDIKKFVESITEAYTLNGKPEPEIEMIPRREVTRKLMAAIDISDIDGHLEKMYNEDGTPKDIIIHEKPQQPLISAPPNGNPTQPPANRAPRPE